VPPLGSPHFHYRDSHARGCRRPRSALPPCRGGCRRDTGAHRPSMSPARVARPQESICPSRTGRRGHTAGAGGSATRRDHNAPYERGAGEQRATTTTAPHDRRGARVARVTGPTRPAIRVARVIRAPTASSPISTPRYRSRATSAACRRDPAGAPAMAGRAYGRGRPHIKTSPPLRVVPSIPVVPGATGQAV